MIFFNKGLFNIEYKRIYDGQLHTGCYEEGSFGIGSGMLRTVLEFTMFGMWFGNMLVTIKMARSSCDEAVLHAHLVHTTLSTLSTPSFSFPPQDTNNQDINTSPYF